VALKNQLILQYVDKTNYVYFLQVTAKSTVLALLKRSSPYNSNVDLLFTESRQRYKNYQQPTNCRSSTTKSTRTATNLGKNSIMQLTCKCSFRFKDVVKHACIIRNLKAMACLIIIIMA